MSLFIGKNSESFEFKPKIQLNRQLFPKIRPAYATTPYRMHQNAMKSDLTKAYPVRFKFKNPLAFSEFNNTTPLHQTDNFSPNLMENDQTNRMLRVTNVNPINLNNPEPPNDAKKKENGLKNYQSISD